MHHETITLYRPVDENELRLIAESGYKAFPPRLPEQPIFYPVCNQQYAEEIASRWNAREGRRGYVTRFSVTRSFLDRYKVRQVGGRIHLEYWIPAEDLGEFNASIVGPIDVIREFLE